MGDTDAKASGEGRVTWLRSEGSRMAHALRVRPVKVREPGVRMSMCGRVAWHQTAQKAPQEQGRCAACLTSLTRLLSVSTVPDGV